MSRVAVLLLVLSLSPVTFAQKSLRPIVITGVRHDTSRPLREMMRGVKPVLDTGRQQALEMEEPPARHVPPAFDPVVQGSRGSAQQAQIINSFEGITLGGAVPPDTNGSPGVNGQYVQTTNFLYAVFDKTTGNITFGPYYVKSLFQGFGGQCETENSMSDPTVRFDKAAQRWIIQQIAGDYGFTPPLYICLAVSTTSDATGSYYRYSIPYGNYLPDYPKLSVWPDAYYLTTDLYLNWNFTASSACALDRSSMLQGGPASPICFQTDSSIFHFLPSDLDGNVPPPQGAPNYVVGNVSGSNHQLNLFKFHVDFANPQNSTFTGPSIIEVAPYTVACWSDCIPQEGTSTTLYGLGQITMYRLAYRNFVPPTVPATATRAAHQSLVLNHTVQNNDGSYGIRWYELRALEHGDFTVFQQSTFSPDSNSRWMGSLAMDKAGDMALGYSISSSTMYPSMNFTGRLVTDPPSTMEQEATLVSGTASQTGSDRWGDYSSMIPDPTDDCLLWYTTEYLSGSQNWRTRIVSLKFPSCH
jgi:hypothetical protein